MLAESPTPVDGKKSTVQDPTLNRGQRSGTALHRAPIVVAPQTLYVSVKRLGDVVIAFTLLVVSSPLLLLMALAVKMTSRGPVLYSQTRVGRGGVPFTIYKIRSMYHECEKVSGAVWSPGKSDPRVMPLGRVLRRTHLDELPQLWNVLCGDMSMVGPRPERPEFVPQLDQAIPHYRERLLVMPGVTGLAQIHLHGDTDLASVERKLAFDLYYIKQVGPWLDVKILVGTAFHVLRPFLASNLLFGLTPRRCAEIIGFRFRHEKAA